MNQLDRRRASWGFLMVVGAALVFAAGQLDGRVVGRLLEQAGLAALLVLVPHLVSMTLEAWAWGHALAQVGARTRFAPLWCIRMATEAMYLLLPGGVVVAESIKPVLLERRAGLSLELGIGATFYRKFLRLAGQGPYVLLAALWGGVALHELSRTWCSGPLLYWVVIALGWLFVGAACGLAWGMRDAGLAERLHGLLLRFPRLLSGGLLERVRHRFADTDTATRAYFRLPLQKSALPIVLSGVCWFFEPLESWLALRVLGLEVPFELVLGVDVAISLVRQVAVFLPGGLGLQEAGYVGALVALGVPAPLEAAAALSVLKRGKDVVWGGFGLGLVSRLLRQRSGPVSLRLGRRAFAAATVLTAAQVLVPAVAWAGAVRTRLFAIARSKNENLVCYDWLAEKAEAPGRLDVYWQMDAERGQREELSGLEWQLAYGYRVVQSSPTGLLTISLKAAPRRPITIDPTGGPPLAKTTIGASQAILQSIYVGTREGALIPSVAYVEIRGRLPNGRAVSERIERPGHGPARS